MKCNSCKRILKKEPIMEIFTVESGMARNFCLNCIKMGYQNLKMLLNPNKAELDLCASFEAFIKKNAIKKRGES